MAEIWNIFRLCLTFILFLNTFVKEIDGQSENETRLVRIEFDPTIPILYQRLCMTPIYTINHGEYLYKIWLVDSETDSAKNTIFMYEKDHLIFFNTSLWINSFDTDHISGHNYQICFKNLTNKEIKSNLFIWKIISKDKSQDISPENYKELPVMIEAVDLKEATTEIFNLNTSFDYLPIIRDKFFCMVFKYDINFNYYVKQLMLLAEVNSQRVTIYTIKRKLQQDLFISTFNETSDWRPILDKEMSKDFKVCFRKLPSSTKSTYIWKVIIQELNNKYILKSKELAFFLEGGSNQNKTIANVIKSGLSIGAIVGIIIAAAVVIIVIISIVVWKHKDKRTKKKKYEAASTNDVEKKQQVEEMDEMVSK